jgi:HAD superfamily hydrolase (TIGR01509 family)
VNTSSSITSTEKRKPNTNSSVRNSLLRSCKAVLFDLDGVLVDSYDCWFRLLQDAMRELGKTPVSLEEFNSRWGQGPEEDRDVFFPEWSLEELMAFYEKRFGEYTRWSKQEPGSEKILQHLQSHDRKIAIASNSPTVVVNDLLKHAGLESYPNTVIGVDQVRQSKPAPDLLLKALEVLHLTKQEVCYVGDSTYDAQASEAAGIFFIGYKRPGEISVKNFEELAQLF